MKILVVNSNTSRFVTDIVARAARAAASPGTEIKAVTGRFGARVIANRTENLIGAMAALELLAEHHEGCDAALIAVSFDPGLRAARELLPIPVVGMTEAAALTACMLGGRFALLTFGRRAVPMYRELIEGYGLAARLADIGAIAAPSEALLKRPEKLIPRLIPEIRRLAESAGAESIVLAGAVFAGLPPKLKGKVPVPVLDGITCGVRQAELLASLKLAKPRTGSFAAPTRNELVKVSRHIHKIYEGPRPRGRS